MDFPILNLYVRELNNVILCKRPALLKLTRTIKLFTICYLITGYYIGIQYKYYVLTLEVPII